MKAVNSLVSRPEGIKDRLKFALKNVAEVGEEHVPHSDRKKWGEVLGGIARGNPYHRQRYVGQESEVRGLHG